jgi:hypothetical protein
MRLLAILAMFLLAGCAVSPHKTTHRLTFDDGICSATAVGTHTILGAEHCFKGAHKLDVDGVPVAVLKVMADGADHVLVIVTATFADVAQIGPVPDQGDAVHYWGNPSGLFDVYRAGYVAGSAVADGHVFQLVACDGFYGDSGAGVFDTHGQLVGVISLMYQNTDRGYIKFMGMYPLQFTAEQWAKIQ